MLFSNTLVAQCSSPLRQSWYGNLKIYILTMGIRTRNISVSTIPVDREYTTAAIAHSPTVNGTSKNSFSSKSLSSREQWTNRSPRASTPQHFYQNRILDQYVSQPAKTITLRQLTFFGRNMTDEKLLKSANYVRTELPIRLAHRIRDFQNLPFIVGTNPHIELVYEKYWSAFDRLRCVPSIETQADNEKFCDLLRTLLNEHLVVIPQLALGIGECAGHIPLAQIDRFMNTMLRSRISRRVIADQHLALTANHHNPSDWSDGQGYIGMVFTHCNARSIVDRCARLADQHCQLTFLPTASTTISPKVIINGHEDTIFTYIPDHIEYIIHELLKNSMRAVVEHHQNTSHLPPIIVTICSGATDLVFRVSDQGGGIPGHIYRSLWSFISSIDSPVSPSSRAESQSHLSQSSIDEKFAGFKSVPRMAATITEHEAGNIIPPTIHLGIGLPMSKVYAEYWGGGLNVMTMEGYGTDAYLRIPKLGNQMENLSFEE